MSKLAQMKEAMEKAKRKKEEEEKYLEEQRRKRKENEAKRKSQQKIETKPISKPKNTQSKSQSKSRWQFFSELECIALEESLRRFITSRKGKATSNKNGLIAKIFMLSNKLMEDLVRSRKDIDFKLK